MKSLMNKEDILMMYASDIILSKSMQSEKKFIQHGNVTVFEHSLSVAYLSIYFARRFNLKVDEASLIRGALLHDYFLYDWHVRDDAHSLHGLYHAKKALINASRDFELNYIEKDIIRKHMFPLNIIPPMYKESIIVCLVDKICATCETLSISFNYDFENELINMSMFSFIRFKFKKYLFKFLSFGASVY